MKKFLCFCFCAIPIAAAGNAAAAEPTADRGPQLVSDLQSTPADREEPPVASPFFAAGCAGICGYCDPPWFVASVDALFMQRRRPTDTVIFIDGNTGATLLNASQFNFDYETGGDANLTFNDYRGWGIDLRYEWLGDSSASASYAVPQGINYYNTSPQSYIFQPEGNSVDQWRYRSRLQTVEINFRKDFERFDGLIGFRYADLSDELNGVQSQTGETVTTTWNSQNNLYGLQTGAETLIWESPSQQIRIQGYGKAGLFANPTRTNFVVSDIRPPVNPFINDAHASLTRAAFLGDLGVTASYQPTRHIALQAGYQMLWFDGVAVANRQVAATGNFNFPGQTTSHVDPAGTVFYQGFKTGMEVTW